MKKRTTKGKSKLYESVTETIGDTPCIRINTLAPKHVNMYVKAEFFKSRQFSQGPSSNKYYRKC